MTILDKTLLIVGGGRWARVYLSLLARIDMPITKVAIVSRHGGDSMVAALAEANAQGKRRFVHLVTLDEALADDGICAAIVVNTARDHARTALTLIEKNIPVLLEKPVALTLDEAERLVSAASTAGVSLMPALVLRFCDYLYEFARAAREALGAIQSIDVRWSDPAGEVRYGEAKGFDTSIGVVEEIAPHIATALMIVAGGATHSVDKAEFSRGGLAVKLAGLWNGLPYTISLERQAAKRERTITFRDRNGSEAKLDFSIEPGSITIGSISRNADPEWSRRASPLTRQLLKFIETLSGRERRDDLDAVRDTTAFTVRTAELVRDAQRRWLCSPHEREAEAGERFVALREVLAPSLVSAALVNAGDNQKLELLAQEAMGLMSGVRSPNATPYLEEALSKAGIPIGTGNSVPAR